mgnify:CR=1 FL=1
MNKQPKAKYSVFCDFCGKRSIVFKDHSMTEIPVAAVPKRADGKDKSTLPRPQMLKCPLCGRGVIMKKVKELKNEAAGDDKLDVGKTGFAGPSI